MPIRVGLRGSKRGNKPCESLWAAQSTNNDGAEQINVPELTPNLKGLRPVDCGRMLCANGGKLSKAGKTLVEPIDAAQRELVLNETERYLCEAERIYKRNFERIPVLFDLKGQTAGMFKMLGDKRWIRYNPWIFAKYFEVNLRDTVPHEVAHYITHEVYAGRTGKPHGPRWQRVMAHFNADAGVTFDLDLDGVPQRKQKTHPYWCGCRDHDVSTTRHNRIVRGKGRYYCRACDGELVPVPQQLPTFDAR